MVDYRTERYETVVPVEEYMEQCVDVPTFLEYCRQCPSYQKLWSCPPFDFDPEAYWRRYGRFRIIGIKIFLPEELTYKSFTNAERTGILNETLWEEKKKIAYMIRRAGRKERGFIRASRIRFFITIQKLHFHDAGGHLFLCRLRLRGLL